MIKPAKSFWLLWILATSISSVIGFALGGILVQFFDNREFALSLFAFLTIWGLIIGVGQWMILRTKLTKAWGWIPATTIGLPSGLFFGYWVIYNLLGPSFSNENEILITFWSSTIAGITTGTLQWFTLRRKAKKSLQWILVSTVSWGLGITALSFIGNFLATINAKADFIYLNILLGAILIGGMPGAVGGTFMESALAQIDFSNNAS